MIDFYCFVVDTKKQKVYDVLDYKSEAWQMFDNLNFDITNAISLNKCLYYCKQDNKFYYNENPIDIRGKRILPRCIIPEMNTLMDAIHNAGGKSLITKEDTDKIYNWPKYIKPQNRKFVVTTKAEFIEHFDKYKNEFGRVFFKTKRKNFYCEVESIRDLGGFESVFSNSDLNNNDNKKEYCTFKLITTKDKYGHKEISDNRFSAINADEEVFVEEFVDIIKDKQYKHIPAEYRFFVIEGKIISGSRAWVSDRSVPEQVNTLAQETLKNLPKEFPTTFVLDIMTMKDKSGNIKYDIVEFNNLMSSGYEPDSSIFKLAGKTKTYKEYVEETYLNNGSLKELM